MDVTWGLVATVLEDVETVKRFVAHHKTLGATELHIFFDDPDDPAFDIVSRVPGVIATRCDAALWGGPRPENQEARQKRNANLAYGRAGTDWIIHIDADELLHAHGGVARTLAGVAAETHVVRLPPAEAFVPPRRNGIDVFRFALPDTRQGQRLGREVYGEEYPLLNRGLLSHTAGKHFVRTGVPEMALSIHGPFLGQERVAGAEVPGLALLHLHGRDEDKWVGAVMHRLDRGAYRAAFHDHRKSSARVDGRGFNAHLRHIAETAGEEGLRAFFRRICVFDKGKRKLRRTGRLLKTRLWLPEKVETVFPGSHTVVAGPVAVDPGTGRLEAGVEFQGSRMTVALEDNYTEITIASGQFEEAEEIEAMRAAIAGRRVLFLDVGGNVGVYSLLAARHAATSSRVIAFEPNPAMADRLERNVALNGYGNVTVHRVALGDADGEVELHLHGNLGQGGSLRVPLRQLADYVADAPADAMRVLKIDIEGAEPRCLAPFFAAVPRTDWPDLILYDHSQADRWDVPPEVLFPPDAYAVVQAFRNNTLIRKM